MKKTVKITIGGIIFHLDEDAYQDLQQYLTAINSRFASTDEGKEIITDIENRIAEILQSKTSEQKQVISLEDVEEIIEIMGRPEDIADESDGTTEETYKASKRLYRDPENRILGGVCSGIASYLNIDPLIIRLLFLVLLFAYGVIAIIYIVLWALLPAALTTAQKMEMRGEHFKISDIEKNVRREYETVKNNLQNFKDSRDYDQTRNFFEGLFSALGVIFKFILKLFAVMIGLVMIIAGLGVLIGLTGTLIIGEPLMPWNNLMVDHQVILPDLIQSFTDPNTAWILGISALLAVFIPLFALVYGGFKLLLGIRPHDRAFAAVGFTAWIISIIILFVLGGAQVKNFALSVKDKEQLEITAPANQTLYLKAREGYPVKKSTFYIFDSEFMLLYDEDDEKQVYAFPEIDILRSSSDRFGIEIIKEGRGKNRERALENTQKIAYQCVQEDSLIWFDPVYPLLNENRWTFPEVDITIRIPTGYIIYLDESLEEQLDDIHQETYHRAGELVNQYWIMTDEGLVRYTEEKKQ
ncbi:MAG: PspC domain-containing protein [Bacteroidales bacterium]|jgi:phage shock protein PspC (stress-responsive transcriptional regulator)|nr:PspC domain-containing protein [Bacteroidales bacterium]